MAIEYAILGFLSEEPRTGYDLKKLFADSDVLYWSGNNNQIYRALVELRKAKRVTQEVEDQDSGPSRKVYTITPEGLAALHDWLQTAPELPQLRHTLLVQLTWADQLAADDLDALLGQYEEDVYVKLLMVREQTQRTATPAPTPRAACLRTLIARNHAAFYEHELAWVRQLRQELAWL